MLAAVSGATGFVGSAVVRHLLSAGRPVRALVEPGADRSNLAELRKELGPDASARLEEVEADVCNQSAMARALEGAHAYYHLAAIYKVWTPNPATIYRVNLEGTTASLLAAQAAGVRRIVYTSSIAGVGLRGDGTPADETVEFNLYDIANEYILTKYLSERIAMRFAESGLPVVVVNPAFPFGPRDVAPTPTGRIIVALLRGQVPGVGEGGFCSVDVDDVAAAHVAAETKGRIGERYILGNHNVPFAEFCRLVCEVAGCRPPKLHIPNAVGMSIAAGMEAWSSLVSHKEPRATRKSIAYMQRGAYFDGSKARRELGMPSTPLIDSIERSVRWFREHGRA